MLKKIIMAFLLICTFSIANADEQKKPYDPSSYFDGTVSNITKLDLNDNRVSIKNLTQGTFIDNIDAGMNFLVALVGTKNLPDFFNSFLKEQGFDKNVEQLPFFEMINSHFVYWLIFVIGVGALFHLMIMIFEWMKSGEMLSGNNKFNAKRLAFIMFFTALTLEIIPAVVVVSGYVIAYSNKGLTLIKGGQGEKTFSTVPTPVQIMTIQNNNSNLFRIALTTLRTNQALMQNNASGILEPSRWFSSIRPDATIVEALEKYSEYSKMDLSVQNTKRVNFDATWKFSNMINFLTANNSVSFAYKADEYSAQERPTYGYPGTIGKIQFNVDGANFESLTNESVNDGTLMKQLMNVSEKATGLSPYAVKKAEELSTLLEERVTNGSIDTSSIYENLKDYPDIKAKSDEIKSYIKGQAAAIIGGTVKIDEISKNLMPESRLMISGFASGAFYAGIAGADNSGRGAKYFLDYAKKGAESRINQHCTENYLTYKANEGAIQKLNASLNTSGKDWLKNNNGFGLAFDCAYYNESSKRFVALGSSDPSEAIVFKAKAMSNKLALDIVMLSVLEGVKQYAGEDETFKNSVGAASLKVLKLGIFGYALDALNESRVENAIAQRDAIVSNSALIEYYGPSNDLHIMTERLYGEKDLSTDDDRSKNLEATFKHMSLATIMIQGLINQSAVTGESSSDLQDKLSSKAREILLKWLGQESPTLKLVMGSDPDLSNADGARACVADPMPCELRPKTNPFVATSRMGDEYIEYGFTLIGLHAALSIADSTIDGLSGSVGEVITAMVGEDKKGISKGLTGAVKLFGKSIQSFITITKAVTGAMQILAYIYITAGILLQYLIPLYLAFFVFIQLIKGSVRLAGLQYVFAPYYVVKMLISRDEESLMANAKAILKGMIGFILLIPVMTFTVICALKFVEVLPVHRLVWHILAGSQTGIIGSILASLVATVLVAMSVITVFKTSTDGHTEIMKRFDFDANYNDETKKAMSVMTDSRAIDVVRAGKDAITETSQKAIFESKANRRMAREQFNKRSGSGGQNFKTS